MLYDGEFSREMEENMDIITEMETYARAHDVPIMEKEGIALPVIEAVCRYKSSAHFEDRLTITGRVAEAKGVRVKIECEVRCGDRLLADGYTVHACMDMKTSRPTRVPSALLKLLK